MLNIPKEAYSYWPDSRHCLIETAEYVERLIFYRQTYKPWELSSLDQLSRVLPGLGQVSDAEKLRFLYGAGWNIAKAAESLTAHLNWVQNWGDYKALYPMISDILQNGGIYIHGRDHRYRPVVYLNPNLLQGVTLELIVATVYFIAEYSIEQLFIPGQIENFVLVVDLKDFCFGETALKVLNVLQVHYPCRLAHAFIYNLNRQQQMVFKYLSKNTMDKVFVNGNENILDFCNVGQVEERFGGKAGNLDRFWPPTFPDSGFQAWRDPEGGFLSEYSSYQEYFNQLLKNPSNLGSFKISYISEKESFFSNSEFKDEVWQKLEEVDASFSFLNTDTCTKPHESEPDVLKLPSKRVNSEDLTRASSNMIKRFSIEMELIDTSCCMEKSCMIQ